MIHVIWTVIYLICMIKGKEGFRLFNYFTVTIIKSQ
jgi:hypothetical protein